MCDECKKNLATVHITKIINGKKIERHLCEQCARNSGEVVFSLNCKLSAQDFLKGMLNHGGTDNAPEINELKCANCGMTYSDFSRNGKIGCSECYVTFGDRLEPLLRRIHGASSHTGKIPKRAEGMLEIKLEVRRLKHELERHVEREEYEQAAKIRDKIKNLEKHTEVIKNVDKADNK